MSVSQARIASNGVTGDFAADFPAAHSLAVSDGADQPKDHFKEVDGVRFAGIHLIVDMWEASYLDDEPRLRQAMLEAVEAAEASLLHLHLHRFTPYGGISGVAVLAESHISVHTWPERSYAAFDIFMCGVAEPHRAADTLVAALRPGRSDIRELRRGEIEDRR